MRPEPRPPLNRHDRRVLRTKGRKPCEECRRWTEFPPPNGSRWSEIPTFKKDAKRGLSWEQVFDDRKSEFFCTRESCVRIRKAM